MNDWIFLIFQCGGIVLFAYIFRYYLKYIFIYNKGNEFLNWSFLFYVIISLKFLNLPIDAFAFQLLLLIIICIIGSLVVKDKFSEQQFIFIILLSLLFITYFNGPRQLYDYSGLFVSIDVNLLVSAKVFLSSITMVLFFLCYTGLGLKVQ